MNNCGLQQGHRHSGLPARPGIFGNERLLFDVEDESLLLLAFDTATVPDIYVDKTMSSSLHRVNSSSTVSYVVITKSAM